MGAARPYGQARVAAPGERALVPTRTGLQAPQTRQGRQLRRRESRDLEFPRIIISGDSFSGFSLQIPEVGSSGSIPRPVATGSVQQARLRQSSKNPA